MKEKRDENGEDVLDMGREAIEIRQSFQGYSYFISYLLRNLFQLLVSVLLLLYQVNLGDAVSGFKTKPFLFLAF